MFVRSAVLRAPEGDVEGGGGGGGVEFSEDQVKHISQIVNSAVSAQLGRNLSKAVGEGLKSMNWSEIIAPEVQKLAPQPAPGDKTPAKAADSDLEKRIQQLADDLEKANKLRLDSESAREKAENGRRVDAARSKLRNALSEKVAAGALDHAVDRLTLVQNRLTVDENGNATLKVKRPEFKSGPLVDVDLSIEEALPVLLAEDDMKIYLPAPSGGGGKNPGPRSGGQLPTYSAPATTDQEKVARALEKERALTARLNIS